MNIRLGGRDDIEKIGKALKGSWLMHVNSEPEFINREVIEESDLKEYFEDCFNNSDRSYIFIAEEDGVVAGCMKVDIQKLQRFFNQTEILYVDDIYTMEEYRGRGVAKLLLEEAEKLAKEKGIKWLKARIYSFNDPAQKTFKAAGFKDLYSEYFKVIQD